MKTMLRLVLAASIVMSTSAIVYAQHATPYAGLQGRSIKALSEQELADLRAGRGMGLALAAELNGYPGPAHVLELADALQLSSAQREKVQDFFDRMKTETIALGTQLISLETELDRQFADKTATENSITAATAAIGPAQAALRNAHLRYHLLTIGVLSPAQSQRYGELRGYGSAPQHGPEHGPHHPH
jgi:hypothetical protein